MNKFFKTALLAATVFSSTFALGQVINVTPKYPGETTEVNVNPLPPQGGAGQGVASGSNPANPPITSPPPPIRMSTAQAKATKEIRDGYRSRVVYIHTYLRKDTWKAEMDKAHEWVALQFKQRDLNAFHIYQELITVRDRIDVTESDIAILKREAASHGWNVSKTVPLTANPVVATVPTTTTPVTPTLTTVVPTTVASAAPVVPAPVLVTQQLLPPPHRSRCLDRLSCVVSWSPTKRWPRNHRDFGSANSISGHRQQRKVHELRCIAQRWAHQGEEQKIAFTV
jgi:hypothetical protein